MGLGQAPISAGQWRDGHFGGCCLDEATADDGEPDWALLEGCHFYS